MSPAEVIGEFAVKRIHLAPNGFLHAGSIVTLADTSCGYGCFASLPEGATGFTTIELKSNHLGTAREGTIVSRATPAAPRQDHAGLGRRGDAPGERQDARDVPLHAAAAVPAGSGVERVRRGLPPFRGRRVLSRPRFKRP